MGKTPTNLSLLISPYTLQFPLQFFILKGSIMNIIKTAICLLFALSLTACASIAGNNTRQVAVKSYPEGATILVDNQQYGVTPAVITLPNYIYGGKMVTLQKSGYQPQSRMVNTKFQVVGLLDIFFWPTFIVDALAGNTVKIDPADLHLEYRLQKA